MDIPTIIIITVTTATMLPRNAFLSTISKYAIPCGWDTASPERKVIYVFALTALPVSILSTTASILTLNPMFLMLNGLPMTGIIVGGGLTYITRKCNECS